MNVALLNNKLEHYTAKMGQLGVPFSEQRLLRLLADLLDPGRLFKSEHQKKILVGRVRSTLAAMDNNWRVHPKWTLNGAASGRWTSEKPSLQNMFPELRGCMDSVLSVDVEQMELYVAAVLASEAWLVNAYEKGEDLHQKVADELGIDRETAKVYNNANLYGQTDIGVAARLGVSVEEAAEGLREWWSRNKLILEHKKRIIAGANYYGFVKTAVLGHERDLSEQRAGNKPIDNAAYSTVVSGTAADLMKLAFCKLWDDGHPVLAVIHDEFVVDPANVSYAKTALANAHPSYRLRVRTK